MPCQQRSLGLLLLYIIIFFTFGLFCTFLSLSLLRLHLPPIPPPNLASLYPPLSWVGVGGHTIFGVKRLYDFLSASLDVWWTLCCVYTYFAFSFSSSFLYSFTYYVGWSATPPPSYLFVLRLEYISAPPRPHPCLAVIEYCGGVGYESTFNMISSVLFCATSNSLELGLRSGVVNACEGTPHCVRIWYWVVESGNECEVRLRLRLDVCVRKKDNLWYREGVAMRIWKTWVWSVDC